MRPTVSIWPRETERVVVQVGGVTGLDAALGAVAPEPLEPLAWSDSHSVCGACSTERTAQRKQETDTIHNLEALFPIYR